jgi:lipoprotein-releasing system permease protein
MFRSSFHGLSGDIIVQGESLSGFPGYEEMIGKMQKLPDVAAAVPTIETFGLINIENQIRQGVQVVGYTLPGIGKVNRFPQSLHLQYEVPREALLKKADAPGLSEAQRRKLLAEANDPVTPSFNLLPGVDYDALLPKGAKPPPSQRPGMIVGSGVVGIHRNEKGQWEGRDGLYQAWAKLTVIGVGPNDVNVDFNNATSDVFWIVDDSRTQLWMYDSKTVYVDFHRLQRDLRMDAFDGQPARCSSIQVKVAPGADLQKAKADVQRIVDEVQSDAGARFLFPIKVQTWEESQALWLNAVEHEKSLVTVLFSLISVVAIFLIFCIFYMIVVEKTRDIGIIKSVGATPAGVAAIFLGYGLAIGVVGSGLGLLLGYGIIHNINFLHHEMSRWLGITIWNPEVYVFDKIPNTMNPHEVIIIIAVAIVSSVLGALIPALRAARMNPVEALRWE